MSTDRTLLGRALERERRDINRTPDPTDAETIADHGGIAARSTRIGGEDVDLEEPLTSITFEDTEGLLSGSHGQPRPREFWIAKQLGQTPPMELLKAVATRQLTGGRPMAAADDELRGPAADFADLVIDIYEGPHHRERDLDALITETVHDLVDAAFAYWEKLPSADGAFPVAAYKPLPALQVHHNVDDSGDFYDDDAEEPAFYHVPHTRSGGVVSTESQATPLERSQVVLMRAPLSSRNDRMYAQSIATTVREWLELIIDVDVHQKRHYSDSQLPAGFLHFKGAVGEDKLDEIRYDIIEASGDPHDLVTTTSEDGVSWIPVGESVVDLEAIQEQQWYYLLVFAVAGIPQSELNIIESKGFAKETPTLKKSLYKNVTRPFMKAIFGAQNTQAIPDMADAVGISPVPFDLDLERFDPVQEQIEREETMTEWSQGGLSLNEFRGSLGHEAEEFIVEWNGEELNIADVPKDILDLMKPDLPTLDGLNGGETGGEASGTDFSDSGSHSEPGPPDYDQDPVLGERDAFDALGASFNPQVVRQLSDTIEVASSFIVSVAYARPTNFLQIEFERDGTNAIYWYGSVEEYRFRNIIQADSKGKYFNRYIRGEYTYARLQ